MTFPASKRGTLFFLGAAAGWGAFALAGLPRCAVFSEAGPGTITTERAPELGGGSSAPGAPSFNPRKVSLGFPNSRTVSRSSGFDTARSMVGVRLW